MDRTQSNLHGSAPEKAPAALLIIDAINDLDFPEGEQLKGFAEPMSERLLALKRSLRERGIPSIYVNDNFGRWQSDFQAIVGHCFADSSRGAAISRRLRPESDDYFVLKPKHSGFYSTTLEVLLERIGADTLILAGMAANICVLFTANDAYMRDYRLIVPSDCVASNTREETDYALEQMRSILKADTRPSAAILADLTVGHRGQSEFSAR